MILPRCRSRTTGSEKTSRAVGRGLSVAENAASISCGVRTGHAWSRTPSDLAAASASLHRFVDSGKSGFWRTATGPNSGRTSLSNSSLLPSSAAARRLSPVMFLPGRARLATNPAATGSAPLAAMTMGIVVVACLAAWTIGLPLATITSTRNRTSSAARSRTLAGFAPVQRGSSAMFRPSIQPRSCRPCRKASKLFLLSGSSGDPPLNLPTL